MHNNNKKKLLHQIRVIVLKESIDNIDLIIKLFLNLM